MPLFFQHVEKESDISPSAGERTRLEILKRALIIIRRPDTYCNQFNAVYSLGDMPCKIKDARYFSLIGAIFKAAGRERHEWIDWAFDKQEIYHYELFNHVLHESAVELIENLFMIEELKYAD